MGIPADLKRRLGLGQATGDPNLDAWAQLVTALRDSTQLSWNGAKQSYLALKKIRADLGLPFMAGPGGENALENVGAWAPDLDQQAVDLMATNEIAINAANDVLQNKRKLIWNPTLKDFGIEALPDDVVRIEEMAGKPVLVLKTGQIAPPSTGTIGIPPLIVGAGILGAAALVVAGLGVYSLIKDTNATLRTIAEKKMLTTLSNNEKEKVLSGKATQPEATASTKALLDGATALKEAEAKAEAAKGAGGAGVDQWTNLIKTGGFIALGLGVLYIVAQLVPKGGVRSTAAAMPLLENRNRRRG
jgi:hypothetical protein